MAEYPGSEHTSVPVVQAPPEPKAEKPKADKAKGKGK